MPTIALDRDELFSRLGRTYTDEEFDELCFAFGVELDDVLDEVQAAAARQLTVSKEAAAAPKIIYYIAVPANRADLLCMEGFARAMNVFTERVPPPVYTAVAPAGGSLEMVVRPSTQRIRPYVVAAVLRGVTFTPARYASFIDLQDKLHSNICRRRTLVAIGTHDLDTLTPPFVYDARAPGDIEFIPLSQSKSFKADALMDFYRTDPSVKHIKPYVDIIASSPVFPVITDSKGTVLSLPPIINGEHSKITLDTKNVFIECTATDLHKAHVVLNTVVTMFSEYAASPFTVETVSITYEEEVKGVKAAVTPDLSTRKATALMRNVNSMIGTELPAEKAAAMLTRMQLSATVTADAKTGEPAIDVVVPPTRSDVLHECDIVEDVAIAYGFNNIVRQLPKTSTGGAQLPINKLTDQLRVEMAAAGYDETLTLALCSREENWSHMLLPDPGNAAVVLANPQTEEFQIARTAMVPGLLKALASNRGGAIRDGIKLFEVSDVMLLDPSTDVGARNERHLAALYTGPTAGFEVIHGLADRLMQLLEVPPRPVEGAVLSGPAYGRKGYRYYLEREDGIPTYFPGRGARLMIEVEGGETFAAGHLGVLHPRVLKNFELAYPASVIEINVEKFLL